MGVDEAARQEGRGIVAVDALVRVMT